MAAAGPGRSGAVRERWCGVLDFNHALSQEEAAELYGRGGGNGARGHSRFDAKEIRELLNDDARSFIVWLYSGRAFLHRTEARIGNIYGEPGTSLCIELTGKNAGLWYDHCTDEGGDLIKLYRLFMGYVGDTDNFERSLNEIAKEFLHWAVKLEQPTRGAAHITTPNEKIAANKERWGTKPKDEAEILGAPIAEYFYRDIHGNILCSVRRYEPKTFRPWCWREIDGGKKWMIGSPAVRPLYHLPEILKTGTVVLTEGEGKADALAALGIVATSVMGGCNATTKTDWRPLKGKTVTIWPDNDKPGQDFARDATAVLLSLGCTVKLVPIPAGKPVGWDAANCIADGEDAAALIAAAVEVKASATGEHGNSTGAGTADSGSQSKPPPLGIKLDFYENLGNAKPRSWVIKGVIAKGETSSWVGPPASGKSALLASVAMHCAEGRDWRGYRSKARVGVVYFALERGQLTKRRLIAMAGPPNLPIAVASEVIDLTDFHCVTMMVQTIRDAEAHFGDPVGLIVIDTYSKGLAAGGGDENSATDQNVAAANLRRVHEQVAVHIALIGHTGKDESRGARGSNAHLADVDIMVQIVVDGDVRTAAIVKNNDGAEGVLTQFTVKAVTLGQDEDGDDITTAIVAEVSSSTGGAAKRPVLSGTLRKAMEMLERAINDAGVPAPATGEYPSGVRVVTLEQWREACRKGGLSPAGTEESAKKAFNRAKADLDAMHRIGIWDGLVWIAYD